MKRKLLSVKELAEELGISTDSVYRAYRTGEIPGAQIARIRREPTPCRTVSVPSGARPPARAGGAHSRNAPVR